MEEIKKGYTRVSEIVSVPGMFDMIPPDVLENKVRIGTNVHEAIHMDFLGFVPDLAEDEKGYYDSYLAWKEMTKASIAMSEDRFYDDALMITGAIDGLLRFPYEDNLVAVDWKTSATCTKAIGDTWRAQGGFYHYLMEQNHVPNVSKRYLFVQLDSKGKLPKVKEFLFTQDIMNECLGLLNNYRSSQQ